MYKMSLRKIRYINEPKYPLINKDSKRVLVICIDHNKITLGLESINRKTLAILKLYEIDTDNVIIDGIAENAIRINGVITNIKDKFPNEQLFDYFVNLGLVYDVVIFEYCPFQEQFFSYEVISFVHTILRRGGLLITTVERLNEEQREWLRSYFDELETFYRLVVFKDKG